MSWVYVQRTGELWRDGTKLVAHGYAGSDDGDGLVEPGEGFNDPSKQGERGVGPLPVGRYTIGPPMQHPTAGPYTMRLEPDPANEMHGRAGFLIHGGLSITSASQGCIVLSMAARAMIAESLDYELLVVADLPATPEGIT
jgi:hypothetical protein